MQLDSLLGTLRLVLLRSQIYSYFLPLLHSLLILKVCCLSIVNCP